jgi:hypothetical protein
MKAKATNSSGKPTNRAQIERKQGQLFRIVGQLFTRIRISFSDRSFSTSVTTAMNLPGSPFNGSTAGLSGKSGHLGHVGPLANPITR